MSSRFEKIIAGAVVAGALTLAGCNAGGGGGGGGESGTPALTDAETIDSTTIELTFSHEVEVTNAAEVASQFTLRGDNLNAGLNVGTDYVTLGSTCSTYTPYSCYATSFSYYVTAATPLYSFSSGSTVAGISAVQTVDGSADKVRLILDEAIEAFDDGGTGYLRLSYTPGDGDIANDGDALEEIALEEDQRGNVRLTLFDPVVTAARTLDATHVELTFNEPVSSTNAATLASQFVVGSRSLSYLSFSFSATAFFASGTSTSGQSLSFTSEQRVATLTLNGPIGAGWDHDGYLTLRYTQGESDPGLKDDDGNFLAMIGLDSDHRGNLEDSVE